ncbi:B3/B4 domain-containing protein [Lutibaculum baratangense]|uniref:B3/B4 tRNA-binding domain-containing protein n=1 Tax=Lutibaculum baratangense AMV1 TaxID=631454 RepID=V4RQ05_9HYPH|nr:phenylalanine--tRNA ligase beta subunit-related protein [Lutibaculum baratangense]ESR27354.1 hypothetical protein N177_0333 [Lutibaculum baratangense AMV1]
MNIDISELGEVYPDFRVAAVTCCNLRIDEQRSEELHDVIASREEEVRRRWVGVEMGEIPGIKVWRDAYRRFGIRRGSYRSSVERLLRNCVNERALPPINAFVDVYNVVSLTHVLPAGANDLSCVKGCLCYRYAAKGDTFHDLADSGEPVDNPPNEGEVVLADDEKVLCRRWNWRQDSRSLIQPTTREAVVVIEDNGCGNIEAAVDDLVDLLGYFCRADAAITTATAEDPRLELRQPAPA